MYIDFHVHAYPEKIAEKAVSSLEECYVRSGIIPHAVNRGTADELHSDLKSFGIDKAVLMPAATKPTQPHGINTWAYELINSPLNSDGRLISFGAAHPYDPDAESELIRVKEFGFRGIKLHPEAMGVAVNDEKCILLCQKCAELGLAVLFHMGPDPSAGEGESFSTPQMLAELLDSVKDITVIAAHMGGPGQYEDSLKYLCGRENLYFDTACTAGFIGEEMFVRMVRSHGADRILFGSDMPWHSPLQEKSMIENSRLDENEKLRIFCQNAEFLLKTM